jgi:nitrilase
LIIVAAVQYAPAFLDLQRSLERAESLILQAGERGAQLVVFPETWLPGYPIWLDVAPSAGLWDHGPAKEAFALLFDNSVDIPGPAVDRLGAAARDAGVILVIGVNERDGGTLYNTALYIDADGVLLGKHRKLIPTYTERLIWGRGDGSTMAVQSTAIGALGSLICWEHWMPLARHAMHLGHELVHAALWPAVKEMHLVASRHYAFEGRCFVIAAGTVLRRRELPDLELFREIPGAADDLLLKGGSAIIDPQGKLLAGPLAGEEGILIAELEPRRVTEGLMTMDTAGHYSRPDVFRFRMEERPLPPS